jgi:glycosyltransferase involved in cell wall biosynthesis
MKNIVFLHQSWRGFEKRDFLILKSHFHVEEVLIYKNFFYKTLSALQKIKKADIIFCWFAYGRAFFALLIGKVLKKKIVVVMGGWDCANTPEINYGALRQGINFFLTRAITKCIAHLADRLLAISEYNKQEILRNVGVSLDKVDLIYHGIPLDCCEDAQPDKEKENLVLTVGSVSKETLERKGLETFIKVASLLPMVEFVLAGKVSEDGKNCLRRLHISENLKITGFVNEEELHALYRKAKVYAQLSYHEQFGCALAEAMAHQCIPVVTDKAAIPEVVGETGYYVPYGDSIKTAEAIKMALNDCRKGKLAKERIIQLFPSEKRENALIELINNLC